MDARKVHELDVKKHRSEGLDGGSCRRKQLSEIPEGVASSRTTVD